MEGLPDEYYDEGILVTRCWQRGIRSLIQLMRSISIKRRKIDVLHLQYTVFLYGDITSAISMPFFLLLLKLYRIPTVVTLHEVVPLTGVNNKFLKDTEIEGNPFALKIGLRQLVKIIVRLSSSVIVHDSFFEDILIQQYKCDRKKINIIPHGIEENIYQISQNVAREILGVSEKTRLLLFFGYLARYKGLEILIDAFLSLKGDYTLLIAGGVHPRLEGTLEYAQFLSGIKKQSEKAKGRIIFTGFVAEDKIPIVFSAADVLVLPYTRLMSASGPLALSVAYNKPFVASRNLSAVVSEPEILFEHNIQGLREKIERFFDGDELKGKSLRYGKTIIERQNWTNVAKDSAFLYRCVLVNIGVPFELLKTVKLGSVYEETQLGAF